MAKAGVFALCCLADAFVLRSAWTGREVEVGQFRRGYFERFDEGIGVAMDDAIRAVFPAFLLTEGNDVGVPPGVTAVAPLAPATTYELTTEASRAPYVVVGAEAPAPELGNLRAEPGEARLVDARTLALVDGRLALVAWDGTRPWRDDATRLSGLRDACVQADEAFNLTVAATEDRLDFRLGQCALSEPAPMGQARSRLIGVFAGPDWVLVTRRPAWAAERWFVWQVLAVIAIKDAAIWWSLGPASAVAGSAALALASMWLPVPAMLTWPITLIAGLVAAAVRLGAMALRRLPPLIRWPAGLAAVAVAAYAIVSAVTAPHSFPPILHAHPDRGQPDTCAIIGYSTAGGASLRRNFGGLRAYLDQNCGRCRDATASLAGGGEVMDWARDAYCLSPASFGTGGEVIFWGAANDDFLWGVMSIARLFIVGQQRIDLWQRNQAPAIRASLARIDEQVAAIRDTARCAAARGSRFVYLHDFLVTDLVAGRDPDRAAMLARRRAAVEESGGTFIDLQTLFAAEAGISWFNDYLHPSQFIHERVAELVCEISPP